MYINTVIFMLITAIMLSYYKLSCNVVLFEAKKVKYVYCGLKDEGLEVKHGQYEYFHF